MGSEDVGGLCEGELWLRVVHDLEVLVQDFDAIGVGPHFVIDGRWLGLLPQTVVLEGSDFDFVLLNLGDEEPCVYVVCYSRGWGPRTR